MRREPHPFSGFDYEGVRDGVVRVTNPSSGQSGLFTWDGVWLEGELTHADPHFLRFIGGPDLAPEEDVLWGFLPTAQVPEPPAAAYYWGRMPEGAPRAVGRFIADAGVEAKDGLRSAAQIDLEFFLDNDRRPDLVPEVYRLEAPAAGGPKRVGTARFVDPSYHRLEVERLWKRVWQMACHVDDIPNVGDHHVYKIAHLSFIVVRTGEQSFAAYQNVCLHRGRTLRDGDGKAATEFRCPYHGWSWNLDGSLKQIPCEWDFPGVRPHVSQLPAAKVETWGGFVFINPDPEAMPLEAFLGPVMIEHYKKFKLESRHKQAHVTRVMPANWKVTMEAFMESYHVMATHPQLLLAGADLTMDRYDVFGHWGRGGHVSSGAASPMRGMLPTRDEALAQYRALADGNREYLRKILGDEVEIYSDAELNDGTYNDLFPNFHPWGGWARINFRFRPYGDDPEKAVMDVILTAPWPEGRPKPPAARPHLLSEDQPWAAAPELGTLARIMDQDLGNMLAIQHGVKAKTPPYVWYSAYQEGKIKNFHENYERWLGLEEE